MPCELTVCCTSVCGTDVFSYHKQKLRKNSDLSVSSHFIASDKWKSKIALIIFQAYFLTAVLLLNREWLGISKGKYNKMRTLRVFKLSCCISLAQSRVLSNVIF